MAARVLVVDDSAVVRKVVGKFISAAPGLELVGTAPNGKLALQRIDELEPDLVILDLEMPEMDGLDVLRVLRARDGRTPVLVFSTVTERAGARTLDALALGANDYITKPAFSLGEEGSVQRMRLDLVAKVYGLLARAHEATAIEPPSRPQPTRSARPEVLAIGASTGGPQAIAQIVSALPARFPVPVVIVQHMPPGFTSVFAERLHREARIPVREARHGDPLEPGTGLVAPGDFHMRVREGRVTLDRGEPEHCCRPAVDALFRSVAETFGPASLAVVLTGMGHDGLEGARAIGAVGGAVLAQDQRTSVVWSMPGGVAEAGLADAILPVGAMTAEILRRVGVDRSRDSMRS